MVANYRDGLTVRVSRGTCDRRLRGGGEAIIASPRSRQCVRVCVSRPQFMLKSVDAVRCAMYGGISDFRTLNTSLYQRDTDQIHKLSRRTLNGSEVRKR